jgi:hypothetical protein
VGNPLEARLTVSWIQWRQDDTTDEAGIHSNRIDCAVWAKDGDPIALLQIQLVQVGMCKLFRIGDDVLPAELFAVLDSDESGL